jgi:MFS family permease
MFVCAMAFIPLTGRFLNPMTQLALLLFLLFGFNLSRGISSAAWLPWITSLVPPGRRGNYLAREAACVNLASCVTFLLAGYLLGNFPKPGQFAALFAFSGLMGTISLVFLKRIPEGESPEQHRTSTVPVPWKEIANYRPFRKLLRMNVAWSIAYGGLGTFTVTFLRTEMGLLEGTILKVNSAAFLGGLVSLWLLGTRMDRLGSKPILLFTLLCWLLIVFGWDLLAGRVLAPSLPVILVLQFAMGLGAAMMTMANTRLAMAIIPVMGRSHFFALFSVVGSLSLGMAPILWGLLLDGFSFLEGNWQGFEWNRFSLFFSSVIVAFLVAVGLCNRLEEPQAGRMEDLLRDLLVQSPQRIWLRFWPRG